jgi:putative addiction module CopG family antidote
MQVHLTEEVEQFVREQLASGKFADASALVEAAIRQMRDRSRKMAEIQRAMLEEDMDPVATRG